MKKILIAVFIISFMLGALTAVGEKKYNDSVANDNEVKEIVFSDEQLAEMYMFDKEGEGNYTIELLDSLDEEYIDILVFDEDGNLYLGSSFNRELWNGYCNRHYKELYLEANNEKL